MFQLMATFLESLDSVRVGPNGLKGDADQAQAEIALALLLGQPLVVSEAYAFDSHAFLVAATDYLDAASAATAEARPRGRDAQSPVRWPYQVALRSTLEGHSSFRETVATLVRNPRFQLSGWPEIDEGVDAVSLDRKRAEVADAICRADGARLRATLRDSRLDTRVNRLEQLIGYFDNSVAPPGKAVTVADASGHAQLSGCVAWLETLDGAALLRGLEREDSAVSDYARELQKGFAVLRANLETEGADPFSTRGFTHLQGPTLVEQDLIDQALLDDCTEFVDTAYNAVVGTSIGASTSSRTTRLFRGSDRAAAADYLASIAYDQIAHTPKLESVPIGLDISTKKTAIERGYRPLLRDLKRLAELVRDEQWIGSARALNEALHPDHATPASRAIANRALKEHVNLLGRLLVPKPERQTPIEFVYRLDEGTLLRIGLPSMVIGENLAFIYSPIEAAITLAEVLFPPLAKTVSYRWCRGTTTNLLRRSAAVP
jgi:hypothetical protein